MMILTIYNESLDKHYKISIDNTEKNRVFITNQDHEGMRTRIDNFSHYLFEAIDKYFKDNF